MAFYLCLVIDFVASLALIYGTSSKVMLASNSIETLMCLVALIGVINSRPKLVLAYLIYDVSPIPINVCTNTNINEPLDGALPLSGLGFYLI